MKIKIAYLVLMTTVLLFACKKEKFTSISTRPEVTENPVFDTCECAAAIDKAATSEYIKANLNGVPVCFDQLPQMNDTFPNMLKYGVIKRDTGDQYYDNLYMIRNAKNSHWQAAMFFENTHALSKTYPYQLPRANPEFCEIGEFQLNDVEHYVSCTWCAENAYNYYAPFFADGLKMTATSFDNNIFEGVFSGMLRTGSGKLVSVTNGQFRIRLVVYKEVIEIK